MSDQQRARLRMRFKMTLIMHLVRLLERDDAERVYSSTATAEDGLTAS